MLREGFVDPFSDQCLLSIFTGIAIDEKASGEILSAFEIGSKAMETFIAERRLEGSERSIFDPIKRLKLATFDNLNKKQIAKTKNYFAANKQRSILQGSNHCSEAICGFEGFVCIPLGAPPTFSSRTRWHTEENC